MPDQKLNDKINSDKGFDLKNALVRALSNQLIKYK